MGQIENQITAGDVTDKLRSHQADFHPVVPFEKGDGLALLDFSKDNKELSNDTLQDTNLFIRYINSKLEQAHARYGIGGYKEYRDIYSRSPVFDAAEGGEPRRLHLGIDIWGKPYTKVMAPIDGIIHSFDFHNEMGNYGATIVLVHNLEGLTIHTLYGHLSLNSIKNIEEGDHIEKGDVFAEFGIPFENGHWPPHLHFQVILDLEGMKGDYPGVCKVSEMDKYLDNCPDPDLILQMMQFAK